MLRCEVEVAGRTRHFRFHRTAVRCFPRPGSTSKSQLLRAATLICLFAFLAPHSRPQASSPRNDHLGYRVKYDLATPNLVHIVIQLPPNTTGPQTLIIPRSVPGGYAQRPYDPFVLHVVARSTGDVALEVRRDEPGPRWILGKADDQLDRVEYDVDVGRMEREIFSAADTSKIRDFYVGLLGYSIFGFLQSFENVPIELETTAPNSWPVFTTLAPQVPAATTTFTAPAANYYALADSQITMGPRLHVEKVEKTIVTDADGAIPLFVSMYAEGGANIAQESTQAFDALRKMVAYFGKAPFAHYSAVLEYLKPLPPPHEYNFSMEHLDSGTFFMDVDHALTTKSSAAEKESHRFNYAHHIAHSWIPKRAYGSGYLPFTWEMEPVIDTIWFNEGFGRYAAIAALAEALPSEDEARRYRTDRLDRLREIVATSPEFLRRMSLDELSREGSFLYSDDFRLGMNLFARGALMAAEMDDAIREQTHNQKSLRDALRHLLDWSVQNHRAFRTEELPQIFREATDVDTTAILNRAMQPLVH